MENVKPWQIGIMVLAVIAVGYLVVKVGFGNSVQLPSKVHLADVSTGELFIFDISGKAKGYYPEKSPDTSQRVLMPVVKNDEGKWFISSHSLPALEDIDGEATAVINTSTGEINVDDSKSPRKFKK